MLPPNRWPVLWLVLMTLALGTPVIDAQEVNSTAMEIRLASTIAPIDAGIVGALEDAFKSRDGHRRHHVGAGTGEALKLAETGKFDLLLVHAKALEERFVAEGYGTQRYDLMYNDFVIMGPPSDPARIVGEKSATAALRKIAQSQSPFITRGDRSGTHVKELEVSESRPG